MLVAMGNALKSVKSESLGGFGCSYLSSNEFCKH